VNLERTKENLSDMKVLVAVCGGLVTVDEESDIIRLVYHTTQRYFERICLERFPGAKGKIAPLVLTSYSITSKGVWRMKILEATLQ
jgi:hypothetical protein